MITFTIMGQPVAQGRPKARIVTPHGRAPFVTVYDPSKSKKWKAEVLKQAVIHRSMAGTPHYPEGTPLKVTLTFRMERPKSLPKRVKHHTKKPDIDNLQKALLDGLGSTFYNDDRQIVQCLCEKVYCEAGEEPGVSVQIDEMVSREEE